MSLCPKAGQGCAWASSSPGCNRGLPVILQAGCRCCGCGLHALHVAQLQGGQQARMPAAQASRCTSWRASTSGAGRRGRRRAATRRTWRASTPSAWPAATRWTRCSSWLRTKRRASQLAHGECAARALKWLRHLLTAVCRVCHRHACDMCAHAGARPAAAPPSRFASRSALTRSATGVAGPGRAGRGGAALPAAAGLRRAVQGEGQGAAARDPRAAPRVRSLRHARAARRAGVAAGLRHRHLALRPGARNSGRLKAHACNAWRMRGGRAPACVPGRGMPVRPNCRLALCQALQQESSFQTLRWPSPCMLHQCSSLRQACHDLSQLQIVYKRRIPCALSIARLPAVLAASCEAPSAQHAS